MYTFKPHFPAVPYKPSEGEVFIKDFFESESIKYQSQVEINGLTGDSCSFRIADFYLPDYGVFVEFLGQWNKEEHRLRYNEKRAVYKENAVPCICFYPDNLGTIYFTFNKRLRVVLNEHNKNRELRKFNLRSLLTYQGGSIFGFLFFLALLIIFLFDRDAEWFWQSVMIVGALVVYNGFNIYQGYQKIFRKGYSYVNFLRE